MRSDVEKSRMRVYRIVRPYMCTSSKDNWGEIFPDGWPICRIIISMVVIFNYSNRLPPRPVNHTPLPSLHSEMPSAGLRSPSFSLSLLTILSHYPSHYPFSLPFSHSLLVIPFHYSFPSSVSLFLLIIPSHYPIGFP